jgi:hypothetical protein
MAGDLRTGRFTAIQFVWEEVSNKKIPAKAEVAPPSQEKIRPSAINGGGFANWPFHGYPVRVGGGANIKTRHKSGCHIGGSSQTRTGDTRSFNPMLYQLS